MEDVTIVEVKPQLVLGMRKRGKYQEIANMIPALCHHADSKGVKIIGAPIFVCHETAEQAMEANEKGNADVDVSIPIAEQCEPGEGMRCYELPGGKMARIVHKGPYEECGPCYEKLFAWLKENGKTITGPTRGYYVNDPKEVKPGEILTEIYAPVN